MLRSLRLSWSNKLKRCNHTHPPGYAHILAPATPTLEATPTSLHFHH